MPVEYDPYMILVYHCWKICQNHSRPQLDLRMKYTRFVQAKYLLSQQHSQGPALNMLNLEKQGDLAYDKVGSSINHEIGFSECITQSNEIECRYAGSSFVFWCLCCDQ